MTEPQPNPQGPKPEPQAPIPSPLMLADAAGHSILSPEVEPSDDAPTIISRTPPRPMRAEDAFAGTLRGRRLAHFELLEPIGVGGMAAVIRARDTQLDRNVALKILPPDMATDPELVRRFQQEARAAAKLDHENIARVFYCGEDQGLHFISFEFVEGDNLRTILERRGRLPVPEAIHYLLQIATGLAHASARGVVHRDIKPSNIIITPSGRAKVVDMGLARNLEPHSDNDLTQSGVTLGTFDYISPEQALEPREADVRSDIYSLGCTFYHMLTGQPPVPEGTAAKKLHHHHHVAPVDPRQLNAAIPDEVAAVLARMMAKDPKDRYQRPEHLVQHLLQLAQKLGAASELPDGVLFVDAPLPNPPRMRPVVVAVAAACVLATLLVLHGIAPWPASAPVATSVASRPAEPAISSREGTSAPLPTPQPGKGTHPTTVPPRPSYDVHSARELADCLAKNDRAVDVFLTQNLDLSREEREAGANHIPGLVFDGKGRDLTIQPRLQKPGQPLTIKLAYVGDLPEGPVWTALTIKGGRVTLKGVRFEVDAAKAPRIEMAAVKLQESGQLKLENCEFIQVNPPSSVPANPSSPDQGRLSSVVVEGGRSTEARPELTLNECYFAGSEEAGGQNAVTVAGAARIHATNCAFGPHATWFDLRDNAGQETELTLRDCSGFLLDGSAFAIDDDLACRLDVRDCLFSRPDNADTISTGAASLIRQTGRSANLDYAGDGNRYYNLSDFWMKLSADEMVPVARTWQEFERKVGSDKQAEVLSTSPWKDRDPLQLLKKNEPRLAFQLNLDQPELRQPGRENDRLVGLQRCSWGTLHEGKLPPIDKKAATTKIVDPAVTASSLGPVYRTLSQAIPDANPGDVILIRHDGPLAVDPVRLEKSALDLTIKAYPGYSPVLTIGETSEKDAALFRVNDGRLKLEHLQFLLRPGKSEFNAQAVVAVAGVGQCSFRKCVATLDAGDAGDVALAVVALPNPTDFMKMDAPAAPRESPEVRFEECFVRGKGDLVAVRASRPLDLKAEDCLVVLDGSFLNVKGNPKEDLSMTPLQVTLSRITAYLTGNLVLLQTSKDVKDLVPVQVSLASDCLFASAGRQSLVHFEGEVTDEQRMKSRFTWIGNHNDYSNFRNMLDQQSKGEQMPLVPYGKDEWTRAFTKDDRPLFQKVKFATPVDESALARAVPADFKVDLDPDAQGIGTRLEELPAPNPETRTALSSPPGP